MIQWVDINPLYSLRVAARVLLCFLGVVFPLNLHITYVTTGSLSDMLNTLPRVFT